MLTVRNGARCGILDALQRCIDLEHVSDLLCALDFEVIQSDAANEGAYAVSGGADTFLSERAAAYLSLTSTEFFRRSNASSMASLTTAPSP